MLELAIGINNNQPLGYVEASYRAGIGRAYYAAFCAARDRANKAFSNSDVHSQVANHYSASGKGSDQLIGNKLKDLRYKRKISDYELRKDIAKKDLVSAITLSKSIMTLLP
ncbi:MAG: hypothetical protein MRY76_10440 [Pseudomonadales bacterium]|nr:hypothetical protein [Pseudomonadales bacterium]